MRLKHGEDSAVSDFPSGGDPNSNYNDRDPLNDNATKWLMGDIITTSTVNVFWDYQLSDIFWLKLKGNAPFKDRHVSAYLQVYCEAGCKKPAGTYISTCPEMDPVIIKRDWITFWLGTY